MAYESDKEQLDALKAWWKDNGRVVVAGLVVGLGGVFGWTTWQSYTDRQAENASRVYAQVVNWSVAGNFQQVDELSESLLSDYPNSGYAPMGALIRAQSAVRQGRSDEAEGYLQWVIEHADEAYLKVVANLGLARLAAEKQDFDAALGLLDSVDAGYLNALYEELRGDIRVALGEPEQALAHYRRALDDEQASAASRRRLDMKTADLGLGVGASSALE